MTEAIRVLLVDDHTAIRIGITAFIEAFDDLLLVGEANTGQAAIEACERLEPDVILMDLHMPMLDGVEATAVINERWPDVSIIALTSLKEEQMVYRVLQAGAIGYLLKSVSADRLAQSIRDAAAGDPALGPEAARILMRAASFAPTTAQRDYELTDREHEVLALMSEGLNNREIANRLTVSRSTVKTHVSHILAKLEVSSRVEAVSLALKEGLIQVG